MQELIKIEEKNGEQLVSARELHKFVESSERFSKWWDRMITYGFIENKDFTSVQKSTVVNNGAKKEIGDYLMKISMAKELSMIQKNEKGKQAREYFIKCEEAWNSEDMILSRALEIQNKKLLNYKEQIKSLQLDNQVKERQILELQPKATYYDLILQCKDLLSVTVIAKDYGMSAKSFNELLHSLGIQYKQSGVWLIYQKYADKGYTQTKTQNYTKSDGTQGAKVHTYWTQKGRLFLYSILKENECLPMIEWEEV